MKEERQQIVIAESRGWKRRPIYHEVAQSPTETERYIIGYTTPPNYLNSRDAMAEALAGLPQEQHIAFMQELCYGVRPTTWSDCWCVLRATPPQLAEAYIRTKGLWEDEK